MSLRFRLCLTWLLLLALPLQGFAAVAMVHCGPVHERMLAEVTAGFAEKGQDEVGHGHHHQHAAGVAGEHPDAGAPGPATDLPSADHLDEIAKFKCSACASCCTGTALPTAVLPMVFVAPSLTTGPCILTVHVDFVLDGLDRPPRNLLV